MKRVVGLVLIFYSIAGMCQLSQLSLSHQAISKINKKNWDKAEQLLVKSIRKDAINPEAKYVIAGLFLISEYPKFNIDSAHYYLQATEKDYSLCSEKEKERLKRYPIDTTIIKFLRQKIDSAAFARAAQFNTINAYNNFIEIFSQAKEKPKAIQIRDEIAFNNALQINTYSAFQQYLEKYSNSLKRDEAKKRYEKLLFINQTKEGKLNNYVDFLKDYPHSEYKIEVEKNIFEISTANGKAESFQLFIKEYPTSNFSKKANNILFYLTEDGFLTTDSLTAVSALNKKFWVPIFKDGKFGFMDNVGKETMAPQFKSIDESYLCGNVTADYLITSDGIISRSGKVILNADVEATEDIGIGFIKVKSNNCWRVIHKSGYTVGNPCLEDAKILASHFVALKEKNKWGLRTLSGRTLSATTFDDIYAEDELIVFVRAGKKVLITTEEVAQLANNNLLKETFVFDNVRSLGQGNYQVSNGSLQGIVSNKLEYVVPLDRQTISQTPYGFLQTRNKKVKTTGISKEIDSKEYLSVGFYGDWIKLKEQHNLILFDGKNKRIVETFLDSIWFENKLAFALREDSITVHLSLTKSIKLGAESEIKFVKSVDSIRFLYATDKKRKTVVEIATGKNLFSVTATNIEYLGYNTFLVEDENKKGLVGANGKILLPAEYNAIVPNGKNYVSLLKDKKFGIYELKTKTLIKPIYERNIVPYSAEKLIAFKDGFYGFVSWKLKDESKFEFDEVTYWNDTLAFVRKNAQWLLYSIAEKQIKDGNSKDFRYVTNTEKEKVVIIRQANSYGVISNRHGTVIAPTYNDIINLGTEEKPLYFTDKFIEEADMHIIIYYNQKGKLIRKEVYETKDYEKIYCNEN